MRVELTRPVHYERIAELIDAQEWTVEHGMYHIVCFLDLLLHTVEPDVRADILKIILSRYGVFVVPPHSDSEVVN